jgi:Family of unknown function (DUF5946)
MAGWELVECPGCHARVPAEGVPVQREYLGAADGCWLRYTELLGREYSSPLYASVHELTVDTYMVQHPGVPERRAAQSVAVHLVGLCLWLEQGRRAPELPYLRKRLVESRPVFPWLEPPAERGALTVLDVLAAGGPEEHRSRVDRWARAAWQAWSPHHAQVRTWADEVSPRQDL